MITITQDFRGTPRAFGLEALLEGVVGFTALSGGLMLAFTHDGSAMGLQVSMLAGSGFGDFFVPGLLLGFVGLMNLAACGLTVARHRYSSLMSMVAGGALVVFMVCETLLLREHSFRQPVMLAFGAAIALLAAPARR